MNPGNPRRFAGFQDQCIQPLCHLSVLLDRYSIRFLKIDKYKNTTDESLTLHHIAMIHTFMAIDTMRNYATNDPNAVLFFDEIRNKYKTNFKRGGQIAN